MTVLYVEMATGEKHKKGKLKIKPVFPEFKVKVPQKKLYNSSGLMCFNS